MIASVIKNIILNQTLIGKAAIFQTAFILIIDTFYL